VTPRVTVAIPVLNGAEYLDQVLAAVRGQAVEGEVELLVVDSGSTDGSLEIARNYDARVQEIPKSEFSHGGTRNLMMRLAQGDHVAFLTQDATPVHDGWLAALLDGFERTDDVAAVFGPHIAREDASHVIKAEMERHFANWGDGRRIHVQRLDRSPEGLAAYRAEPGLLTFLSSVNFCLAKSAWEQIPFRDVPYAEDQLLGRELIEAGFAKVFHPRAAVLHSHHYPPRRFLQRYFDEYRGLREVLDHREPAGPRHFVRSVRYLTDVDREWLRRNGVGRAGRTRALLYSRRHHSARLIGATLGSRAARLPAWLRRRLSLDGRETFTRYDVPKSTLLVTGADVEFSEDWAWEFVRRSYPSRPIAVEPHGARPPGPLTIAWVVPPWGIGSGGHAVIFRLIGDLERRGHRCAIFVFDPLQQNPHQGYMLHEEICEHFTPIEAQVFRGLDDFVSADVAVATNWWTAYPVRDLPRCREKVYFVQDHEPQFVPTSAETLWAEETYRMGYRAVAYTPWLAGLLRDRYGLEVAEIVCGTDTETYTYGGPEERERGLIVVYARRETARRAVELAFAGLASLFERRSGQRVVLYGSSLPITAPFPAENIGVVSPRKLAALYRRASAGLVLSMTNLSLVTQEMMACGLPVVELDGENVTSVLGRSGELAMLGEPRPDAIADALASVLDDPEAAATMASRASAFVESRTWRRAGDELEQALWRFLAEPRVPPAPSQPEVGKGQLKLAHRALEPDKYLVERAPVTELLFERAGESADEEIASRAAQDETPVGSETIASIWGKPHAEPERRRLTLTLGVHYSLPGVLEPTGLVPALPPDDIHHMTRGPLAAEGSLYDADLVVDALAGAGTEPRTGMRALDFGCSSGRVVSVLAAAYPDVEWHGCDPIESSIAWAAANRPGVEFRVSPTEPPLDYEEGFFDLVFAISIWSHFAEPAAVRWLEEMQRIVRPGGHLVLTTHGYQTLAFYDEHASLPRTELREIRDSLYRSGFWFGPVFGEHGDWGLQSPEWGLAFLTPEWLLRRALSHWHVDAFGSGRNQNNQDVFVLGRARSERTRGYDARDDSPAAGA
jgi:O-antigen biosynthesis protein